MIDSPGISQNEDHSFNKHQTNKANYSKTIDVEKTSSRKVNEDRNDFDYFSTEVGGISEVIGLSQVEAAKKKRKRK